MLATRTALHIALLAALAVPASLAGAPARAADAATPAPSGAPGATLEVDGRMRKQVDFWLGIYTRYYTHQGVIHDAKKAERVYEVVDLRGAGPREAKRRVQASKKRWRAALLSLHRKRGRASEALTADEAKVAALFADESSKDRFARAADAGRMRMQLGQKDRFLSGLHESGRYLPQMERIFREHGLPVELTRLPFVESSFNLKAHSKVGASGIWQFMRSTGRRFVRVDPAVDERNDPIRATEAAARLLKSNYEQLGSWPLAVTAYNHGPGGVRRAMRKIASEDLSEIVTGYRSRSFGFASRNFYAELLAAVEAERGAEKYFGTFVRAKPLRAIEVTLPDYVGLRELCRFLKIEPEEVRALNPALTASVFRGKLWIPKGYRLRLPDDPALSAEAQVRVFMAGYSQIPALYKQRAQKGFHYVTRRVKVRARQL